MSLDSQGDLGNLDKKTQNELVDLLTRQEKLLANPKFLHRLPDKGAKIKQFAKKLQKLIEDRDKVEDTVKLLEKMRIEPEIKQTTMQSGELDSDDDDDIDTQETMLVGEVKERVGMDMEVKPSNGVKPNQKESRFKRTSSDKKFATDNVFLTMGKAEPKKQTFKPYRTLKSDKIPDSFLRPAPPPDKIRERCAVEEISVVKPPKIEHSGGAKILDLKESVALEQKQQKIYEEILAKHAAERLTQRINITMETHTLTDLNYREVGDDDSESEDETNDVDD
ncbi:DNA-directed RNA polymerase II subunit GRINL1A-like [Saccoglossus kowalevskii]|uniref:DNA-directed RNA polymerase II subunit GRINL1A-like n=1 Tax=Saccoglossus kowalevskii TaxID=10224 RepID=A0ABM0LV65_SACKO|nr:PREDICTED: DNA-directed RNA polymerase II subunit GRINL1A-like [Saccoglossus kowalevskii]